MVVKAKRARATVEKTRAREEAKRRQLEREARREPPREEIIVTQLPVIKAVKDPPPYLAPDLFPSFIERLTALSKFTMRGKPISVSLFIREHLVRVREDYPFHIWQVWRYINQVYYYPAPGYYYCTYDSFRRYINHLHRLGLIRRIGPRVPTISKYGKPIPYAIPRQNYELVKARYDWHKQWGNPAKATEKLIPKGVG